MNVFGSQILFGYLIDPKMAIFRLPFSDIAFGSASSRKKGVHFLMKSTSENGVRIWFYTIVMGGNKLGNNSKTVFVLLLL